jgi:hypothetical protein
MGKEGIDYWFIDLPTESGRHVTLVARPGTEYVELLGNLEHCTKIEITNNLIENLKRVVELS